jgi:hypothetical protein
MREEEQCSSRAAAALAQPPKPWPRERLTFVFVEDQGLGVVLDALGADAADTHAEDHVCNDARENVIVLFKERHAVRKEFEGKSE